MKLSGYKKIYSNKNKLNCFLKTLPSNKISWILSIFFSTEESSEQLQNKIYQAIDKKQVKK